MKEKMLILRNEAGIEYFRCSIAHVVALRRSKKSIGPAGYLDYCTVYTLGGDTEVFTDTYEQVLEKIGWTYNEE